MVAASIIYRNINISTSVLDLPRCNVFIRICNEIFSRNRKNIHSWYYFFIYRYPKQRVTKFVHLFIIETARVVYSFFGVERVFFLQFYFSLSFELLQDFSIFQYFRTQRYAYSFRHIFPFDGCGKMYHHSKEKRLRDAFTIPWGCIARVFNDRKAFLTTRSKISV